MTAHSGADASAAEVLIVGAGPVGLVAACELLQQGIPVRIIERSRQTSEHSRAIAVWPRSLELLRRLGVSGALAAAGNRLDSVGYYSQGRMIGAIDLCRIEYTPYPFGLIVPQACTEAVLAARLAELGGQIERGVEFTGLDLDGPCPLVTLRHEAGQTERVAAAWLIGADGAHSTVRTLAKIPFTAVGPEVLFAIGDGKLDGGFAPHTLQYCYTRHGALGLAPFGHGRYRVAVSVPGWKDQTQAPPLDLFQAVLSERAPVPGQMRSLEWSTIFAARRHTAATFRAGRCFLAGDAAHIFSAAGGQGMNTGIQDAVNLAWKLGGVLQGRLDKSVLDTYDPERQSSTARISAFTARQTSWGIISGRGRLLTRDLLLRGATRTGVLQRIGAPLTAQHDVRYGPPRTWRDVVAAAAGRGDRVKRGDRVPVFATGGIAGSPQPWPAADPNRFTVLLRTRGRHDSAWASRCTRIVAALPGWAEVLDISVWPGLDRAAGHGSGAMIVRPDGHAAAGWCAAEPSAIVDALAQAHMRFCDDGPSARHPQDSKPEEAHVA